MVAPVSMALGNHYYYRSKQAAELKAKEWHKSDPTDVFKYGGEQFFNQGTDYLGVVLRLKCRASWLYLSGLSAPPPHTHTHLTHTSSCPPRGQFVTTASAGSCLGCVRR